MNRLRSLLCLCAVLLLAGATPLPAATYKFLNRSDKGWKVRVLPDGANAGSAIEVGGTRHAAWSVFALPEKSTIAVEAKFPAETHGVRFQLIDLKGNWIEVLKAKDKPLVHVANNLHGDGFDAFKDILRFNDPDNGAITIRPGAGLLADKDGSASLTGAAPLALDPPFRTAILVNRSKSSSTWSITSVLTHPGGQPAPTVGELHFTDANGRALPGSPLKAISAAKITLPGGSVTRMLWKTSGADFHREIYLTDSKGKTLALELKASGEGQGILMCDFQDKAHIVQIQVPKEGTERCLRLASDELVILGDALPW